MCRLVHSEPFEIEAPDLFTLGGSKTRVLSASAERKGSVQVSSPHDILATFGFEAKNRFLGGMFVNKIRLPRNVTISLTRTSRPQPSLAVGEECPLSIVMLSCRSVFMMRADGSLCGLHLLCHETSQLPTPVVTRLERRRSHRMRSSDWLLVAEALRLQQMQRRSRTPFLRQGKRTSKRRSTSRIEFGRCSFA